jgi:hypothetical protein
VSDIWRNYDRFGAIVARLFESRQKSDLIAPIQHAPVSMRFSSQKCLESLANAWARFQASLIADQPIHPHSFRLRAAWMSAFPGMTNAFEAGASAQIRVIHKVRANKPLFLSH